MLLPAIIVVTWSWLLCIHSESGCLCPHNFPFPTGCSPSSAAVVVSALSAQLTLPEILFLLRVEVQLSAGPSIPFLLGIHFLPQWKQEAGLHYRTIRMGFSLQRCMPFLSPSQGVALYTEGREEEREKTPFVCNNAKLSHYNTPSYDEL